MANSNHKGTELNNVKETWEQNERNRKMEPDREDVNESKLQKTIQEEAAEYDHSNKEERLLGGERASVSDDEDGE
jgi:hypothetical protein